MVNKIMKLKSVFAFAVFFVISRLLNLSNCNVEIQGPSEKHYCNVRCVLYSKFLKFKACVETEKRI